MVDTAGELLSEGATGWLYLGGRAVEKIAASIGAMLDKPVLSGRTHGTEEDI